MVPFQSKTDWKITQITQEIGRENITLPKLTETRGQYLENLWSRFQMKTMN